MADNDDHQKPPKLPRLEDKPEESTAESVTENEPVAKTNDSRNTDNENLHSRGLVADKLSPDQTSQSGKKHHQPPTLEWAKEMHQTDHVSAKLELFRSNALKSTLVNTQTNLDAFLNAFLDEDKNPPQKLVIITHGFLGSSNDMWLPRMMQALCNNYKGYVVAILDWGEKGIHHDRVNYANAAYKTEAVGKWLGQMVLQIKARFPDIKIWGIAHSLGSHLLGFAGRESDCLDRISGLDPAGPLFDCGYFASLCATDANFVDVYHTDGYWESSNKPRVVKVKDEDQTITLPGAPSIEREQALESPTTLWGVVMGLLEYLADWVFGTIPIPYFGSMRKMGTVDFFINMAHNQPVTEGEVGTKGISHSFAHFFFYCTIVETNLDFSTSLKLFGDLRAGVKPDYVVVRDEKINIGFKCEKGKGPYFYVTDKQPPYYKEQK